MQEKGQAILDAIDLSGGVAKGTALALAAYGSYRIGKFAYRALCGFTKYCLLPRGNLHSRYSGGYALITGASDGIGLGYARELAAAGFDVILMARNKEKLDKVAEEIRKEYKV